MKQIISNSSYNILNQNIGYNQLIGNVRHGGGKKKLYIRNSDYYNNISRLLQIPKITKNTPDDKIIEIGRNITEQHFNNKNCNEVRLVCLILAAQVMVRSKVLHTSARSQNGQHGAFEVSKNLLKGSIDFLKENRCSVPIDANIAMQKKNPVKLNEKENPIQRIKSARYPVKLNGNKNPTSKSLSMRQPLQNITQSAIPKAWATKSKVQSIPTFVPQRIPFVPQNVNIYNM